MIYRLMFTTLIGFFSLILSDQSDKKPTEVKTISIPSKPENRPISTEEADDVFLSVYEAIQPGRFTLPDYSCFVAALKGYESLSQKGLIRNAMLTVIDFNLPSSEERLWVIDMDKLEVVCQSLVAHGKNSGELYASQFSDLNESNKSSLGFYLTGETYNGVHGQALKLDGLERGKNGNARDRAIVMHGADYVSYDFIRAHNRLGRSQGCPALPLELTSKIIGKIKNGSCLFINHCNNTDIRL